MEKSLDLNIEKETKKLIDLTIGGDLEDMKLKS